MTSNLTKCSGCAGHAYTMRPFFDGEVTKMVKTRCRLCKGFGWLTPLQRVNNWKRNNMSRVLPNDRQTHP